MTLPATDMPHVPALRTTQLLREPFTALAKTIENETREEASYMLSLAALARLLDQSRETLLPPLALTLACETLLAVAKTAPFPAPSRAQPQQVHSFAIGHSPQ